MGSSGGIEVRGGLPFLVVEGSHREVGRQIGELTAGVLRHAASFDAVALDEVLLPGRSREGQLALASRYRGRAALRGTGVAASVASYRPAAARGASRFSSRCTPGTVAARWSRTIAVWRTRSSMSNEACPVP